ncbi:hypothetical protein D3C81_482160 [compost metagenome]
MFAGGALALQADGFGACRRQLRAGTRQIELADVAQVVAALVDMHAFLAQAHRLFQGRQFRIRGAQLEVGLRHIRLQGQQHGTVGRFHCQRIAARSTDVRSDSAEQVDFVAGRQVGLVDIRGRHRRAIRQAQRHGGGAVALAAHVDAHLRNAVRFGDAGNRPRLLDAGGGDGQVGVGLRGFANQAGQGRIIEGQPPFAARLAFGWHALLPARAVGCRLHGGHLRFLERGWRFDLRLLELGRRAGGQQHGRCHGRQGRAQGRSRAPRGGPRTQIGFQYISPSRSSAGAAVGLAAAAAGFFSKRCARVRSNT